MTAERFTCPDCGRTSHHPMDVLNRYCGACHVFHPRCCRTCEWWDGGGEKLKPTALTGDCLNRASDRFTPEWDHHCPQWMQESTTDDG